MQIMLSVLNGRHKGENHLIGSGETKRIGRGSKADVVIEAPQISRLHCEISNQDFQIVLTDLDSSNGTFLNDKCIKSAKVHPGDRLRVGSVILAVLAWEPPGADDEEPEVVVEKHGVMFATGPSSENGTSTGGTDPARPGIVAVPPLSASTRSLSPKPHPSPQSTEDPLEAFAQASFPLGSAREVPVSGLPMDTDEGNPPDQTGIPKELAALFVPKDATDLPRELRMAATLPQTNQTPGNPSTGIASPTPPEAPPVQAAPSGPAVPQLIVFDPDAPIEETPAPCGSSDPREIETEEKPLTEIVPVESSNSSTLATRHGLRPEDDLPVPAHSSLPSKGFTRDPDETVLVDANSPTEPPDLDLLPETTPPATRIRSVWDTSLPAVLEAVPSALPGTAASGKYRPAAGPDSPPLTPGAPHQRKPPEVPGVPQAEAVKLEFNSPVPVDSDPLDPALIEEMLAEERSVGPHGPPRPKS